MSQYASLFTGEESEEQTLPPEQPKRYRILLVDDEPNVLNALRRVFRQESYNILTANNGEEALGLLAKES